MRVKRVLKLLAGITICSIFLSVCLWSQCNHGNLPSRQDQNFYRDDLAADRRIQGNFDTEQFHQRGIHTNSLNPEQEVKYHAIDCIINGEYNRPVKCRRDNGDIYVPFDFIKNYFEVYGKLETGDGYEHLAFSHVNSMVHPPRNTYSPSGIFMSFEFYHVEERDRVKCISGMEGVPISTQWTSEGHHYPIQIAQYGLSHHSKHVLQGAPEVLVLEDGEEDRVADWIIVDKRSQVTLTDDTTLGIRVVEFASSDSLKTPGLSISADEKTNHFVSVDLKFISNGSLSVMVETQSQQVFHIHYVLSSTLILIEGRDIYYGLGPRRGQWIHVTRDISIDLQKGLALRYNKGKRAKLKYNFSKITIITIRGHGWLDNLTLASSAHLDGFYSAADWLVTHQNDRGGWPVMVRRKLVPGLLELPPGWYSAMAQGQAMSLLVRAYLSSEKKKYLRAAMEAMKLFEISSEQGGVLAKFANTYEWYEEYPTTPSSFVLNGFIYSLLGLYDLKEVASGDAALMAERLYNVGLTSLKFMLLLFDTGSGTLYDLRHVALGVEPNRARWDYHTTHINQLLQLSVIDKDPLFKTTANRWMGYMKGKRSHHN
ncbi:D-glucuronyl C5-epimerase B-like [Gigantopelta aegis]|uniref:D-glucuronyl C5-epimerase B-like n=1 Tax=Gigantopelta aegis TaxID=1735272 RepID=UPI001B88CCFB|nr:D-glucuronyl C5-epimerase B-like [Gigantopelta aegis]